MTVACSWAFLLNPLVTGIAHAFKLPSQCKTCSLAPYLKLIWARRRSGQYSRLEASVFCNAAASVLHISLTSEKTEKANGLQSIKIDRRFPRTLWAILRTGTTVCHVPYPLDGAHLIFKIFSSLYADPWHFGVDPDPDPRIKASD